MDALGFNGQVEEGSEAHGAGCTAPDALKRRRGRDIHAGRTVVSELSSQLPVTEEEIRLVLALLGDTIHDLLNPGPGACVTPATTDDV